MHGCLKRSHVLVIRKMESAKASVVRSPNLSTHRRYERMTLKTAKAPLVDNALAQAFSWLLLACFLGRHRKDCALERIFLGRPRPSTGAWNLQVDPRTASASNPRLVIDGDPLLRLADAD